MPKNMIYAPYDRELWDDIVRFSDGRVDPSELTDFLIRQWIERTIEDEECWGDRSDEVAEKYAPNVYAKWCEATAAASGTRRVENQPLVWKEVSVPAGSEVRMAYGDTHHYATVQRGRITYKGKDYSPSRWACVVAGETSRNAWRDLWFKPPLSKTWLPAQLLRDQAREEARERTKPLIAADLGL